MRGQRCWPRCGGRRHGPATKPPPAPSCNRCRGGRHAQHITVRYGSAQPAAHKAAARFAPFVPGTARPQPEAAARCCRLIRRLQELARDPQAQDIVRPMMMFTFRMIQVRSNGVRGHASGLWLLLACRGCGPQLACGHRVQNPEAQPEHQFAAAMKPLLYLLPVASGRRCGLVDHPAG